MKCRTCSADIDAKAIVCYRCGTPTAARAGGSGASRRGRSGALVTWLVMGLLAALAAAAYFAFWR